MDGLILANVYFLILNYMGLWFVDFLNLSFGFVPVDLSWMVIPLRGVKWN